MNEALTTGLRVVDTILPIGRGQRQVIIGDRFTGKLTTTAIELRVKRLIRYPIEYYLLIANKHIYSYREVNYY